MYLSAQLSALLGQGLSVLNKGKRRLALISFTKWILKQSLEEPSLTMAVKNSDLVCMGLHQQEHHCFNRVTWNKHRRYSRYFCQVLSWKRV